MEHSSWATSSVAGIWMDDLTTMCFWLNRFFFSSALKVYTCIDRNIFDIEFQKSYLLVIEFHFEMV